MANYTMTMVLENVSMMNFFGLVLNGSSIYPSDTTMTVAAGSTLACAPDYGSVYLNGANLGRSHTHTINSNITVTCATDYNVYIVTEESDDSGGSGGGHKALIDGNAYSISGGKAMVNGEVYDISYGKAMIGGEVYEIAFGPSEIQVTITGKGNAFSAYITINGTKYVPNYDTTTVTIPADTTINLYIRAEGAYSRTVTVNGEIVHTEKGGLNYDYKPNGSIVTIKFNATTTNYDITIEITEQ